jgi:hypothetical protein
VSVATPPAGGGTGGYTTPTAAPQPSSEACPLCGATLDPEQEWCLRCGAAARTRLAASPSWKTPVIVLAALVALSLGVLAAALVSLAGGSGHSTKAPVTVIVTAAPTTTPTATIPPTTAVPPTTTAVPGTSTPTATTPPSTTTAPGATTTSPGAATPGDTTTAPGLTTPTTKSSTTPTTPKATTTTPGHTTTGATPPASNPLVEESPKK